MVVRVKAGPTCNREGAQVNIIEIAWLAGLLEGEGCFYIRKGHGATPKITLSMTDEDVLARAALLMDKPYRLLKQRHEGNKPVFRTEICGEKALQIMRNIFPFMGKRRTEKIIEVMAIADARPKVAFGDRHGIAKFSNEEVLIIRKEYALDGARGSQTRLAKKYGVPVRTMCGVLRQSTYSQVQ